MTVQYAEERVEEQESYATEYVRGLRAVADWFEQHPELVFSYTDERFHLIANTKDELLEMRRALGRVTKDADPDSPYFTLRRMFSANVQIDAFIARGEVCRKVVKGSRHVEARLVPAHDEEIVEWVCEEPLLGGTSAD